MIDIKEIFDNDEIVKSVGLWLPDDGDSAELAGAAEYATEMGVGAMSVVQHHVSIVWPWVERLKLKIMSRFYVDSVALDTMSTLAMDIKSVFKQGADGAQVIVRLNELGRFVDSIVSVRDDLFFQKDLSIGLDIFEVWPLDWDVVFNALNKIHASSLLLILTQEAHEKSDFTGRIYGALSAWDADSNMELHVMLDESFERAEQVYRLVAKMRPELLDKLHFWISY